MARPRLPEPSSRCSVVVPVRNDATELRHLLAALSRQTLAPFEVIVVDNGSSDDTAAVAREAGCRVITHEPRGIAGAASTGYDAARGELIVRCDADSRPPPGWLAAHAALDATAPPDTVIFTGPAAFDLPRPWGFLASVLYLGAYFLLVGAALGHWPAFGTTMSMRARWWRDVGEAASRSPHVHDDMDLSFLVRPSESVAWSRSVGVGMSPRALRWGRAGDVRLARAITTLRRQWVLERPWQRWAARRQAAGARRGRTRGSRPDRGTRRGGWPQGSCASVSSPGP